MKRRGMGLAIAVAAVLALASALSHAQGKSAPEAMQGNDQSWR